MPAVAVAQAASLVFDLRGLTKTYRVGDVEVQALRDVTLTIPQGEFVVLLGPSGSGKSTLLNIMGGLDVPTTGEVRYQGEDLAQPANVRSPPTAGSTWDSSSSSTT